MSATNNNSTNPSGDNGQTFSENDFACLTSTIFDAPSPPKVEDSRLVEISIIFATGKYWINQLLWLVYWFERQSALLKTSSFHIDVKQYEFPLHRQSFAFR